MAFLPGSANLLSEPGLHFLTGAAKVPSVTSFVGKLKTLARIPQVAGTQKIPNRSLALLLIPRGCHLFPPPKERRAG
jgi:hypothetical protein